MSKQYFKSTMIYDNGCGGESVETLYIKEDNSIDYRTVVCKNGEFPEPVGSDWYCQALSVVISLQNSSDNENYNVITEECNWNDLPDKVKEFFEPTFSKQTKNSIHELREYLKNFEY